VLLVSLFGGAFLAGLLIFAPAALVGHTLAHASGGLLALAQTEGSLWRGSGTLVLKHKTRYQTLGIYRWILHPWSNTVRIWAGTELPMTLSFHPLARRIDIDALHLRLPATALELLSAQLGPYQLQGMLDARSDHISLDTTGMNGNVIVDWKQAASGLSPIHPLGDYHIVLQGNGSGIDALLTPLSGKLILNAHAHYDAAHGLQVNGTAQAAPEVAAELSEMLHHIGPEIRPGVYNLALMPQARTNP
jgi:general secretion pathway protein N